jgi:Polysaccharide pyruvyl transferase
MARLWASASDSARLAEARSSVLLVGGYDGSGNYGDVAQLLTSLQTVAALPEQPLALVVIEGEMGEHHRFLAGRYGPPLDDAVVAHYAEDEGPAGDGLVELRPGSAPARSALYMYGGGHLNHRWGTRKVSHALAAEGLVRGRRPLPVVASGLQLDEAVVAPGGVAHELLVRAAWIGVRDPDSLGYLRAALPALPGDRLHLAADDALPLLSVGPSGAEDVVNLHLNDGIWVSEDAGAMARRIVALLAELGRAVDRPLELQPIVAYEDSRVSEQRLVSGVLDEFGSELERAGVRVADPVDVLDDAVAAGLARFRRARFTVACSYHVTLTSLMAGIPALLLADNEYYEQKAAGLRELFALDGGLLGVKGSSADAARAAEVVVDGDARDALVDHLRIHARRVAELYERGRAEAAAALADGLRGARLRDRVSLRLRGA